MIVEHRTYTLQAGAVGPYQEDYGPEGLALHEGHLGTCVGHYHCELGTLNQIVMMWQFDSWEQRMQRKAKLDADPEWRDLLISKLAPKVQSIESKLLIPWQPWVDTRA